MSNEQDTNHTDLSRRRLLGAGFALSGLALAGCATAPDSGPSIGRVRPSRWQRSPDENRSAGRSFMRPHRSEGKGRRS